MNQNQVYDEESQMEDLNMEADRVIAMNPSGVIENFESNGKKISCDGNQCVILGNDEVCENGICENKSSTLYTKYVIYFIIFILLCVFAYFAYKKYTNCSS
jgi:hypothetical protein